jgi:hypothetical protein
MRAAFWLSELDSPSLLLLAFIVVEVLANPSQVILVL